jgi:antirestriction protein ArdC
MQKPDATLCAGFKTWKAHKRYVRKGEKAIWILGPYVKTEPHRTTDDLTSDEMVVDEPRIVGYFPVPTFDISQTEGEPLDLGANQVKFLGQEFTLEDIVSKFPEYPVKIVDRVEDGRAVKNVIEVSRRKNRAQMIISYFHELAHILLGHTSSEQVRGVDRSRSLEELEAEAVAYIVGSCLGIESEDSVTYITGWNGNPEKLKKVTFSIAKTADRILRRFTTTSNDSTSCVYNKTYGGS